MYIFVLDQKFLNKKKSAKTSVLPLFNFIYVFICFRWLYQKKTFLILKIAHLICIFFFKNFWSNTKIYIFMKSQIFLKIHIFINKNNYILS